MSQVEADRNESLSVNLQVGSEILPVQLTASSLVSEATQYLRVPEFADPIGKIVNKSIREAKEADQKSDIGLVLYQVSQTLLVEKALDADRFAASSAILRRAFMHVDPSLVALERPLLTDGRVNEDPSAAIYRPLKLAISRDALLIAYPGVSDSFGEVLEEDQQDLLKRWLGDYKPSITEMKQYCENYMIEQWRSVDPCYKAAGLLMKQARLVS